MAFDLERFYKELDECYAAHDNSKVEEFFKKNQKKAYADGLIITPNDGCPSCVPPIEPNWGYIAVCNEMACFYRGLSRFKESLDTFSLAQEELESLYFNQRTEYATVLLNKAGTYRYMGELESALEYFGKAAKIFETSDELNQETLAGLYNNIGLVYMDKQEPQKAVEYFEKALELIRDRFDKIVELGTTWNNLAVGYHALKRQVEADEAVKKAIQILEALDDGVNPHYPAALNTRGTFSYHSGMYEQALEDFKKALEKTRLVYGENIEYAYGCSNCAAVYRQLGDADQAKFWEEKEKEIRDRISVNG